MQGTSVQQGNNLSQDSMMERARLADNLPYCFLHTEGTSQQDSSFIRLTLKGNAVEGTYNWFPEGKDSRQGTLNGKKYGDTLDVTWTYMQEGSQDTLHTRFTLKGDRLAQQPFTVDEQNGRQLLDERAAFSIEYDKINCIE